MKVKDYLLENVIFTEEIISNNIGLFFEDDISKITDTLNFYAKFRVANCSIVGESAEVHNNISVMFRLKEKYLSSVKESFDIQVDMLKREEIENFNKTLTTNHTDTTTGNTVVNGRVSGSDTANNKTSETAFNDDSLVDILEVNGTNVSSSETDNTTTVNDTNTSIGTDTEESTHSRNRQVEDVSQALKDVYERYTESMYDLILGFAIPFFTNGLFEFD